MASKKAESMVRGYLRKVQGLQAKSRCYIFHVDLSHFEGDPAVHVTVQKEDGSEYVNHNFYTFYSREDNEKEYNGLLKHLGL